MGRPCRDEDDRAVRRSPAPTSSFSSPPSSSPGHPPSPCGLVLRGMLERPGHPVNDKMLPAGAGPSSSPRYGGGGGARGSLTRPGAGASVSAFWPYGYFLIRSGGSS